MPPRSSIFQICARDQHERALPDGAGLGVHRVGDHKERGHRARTSSASGHARHGPAHVDALGRMVPPELHGHSTLLAAARHYDQGSSRLLLLCI